VQADGNATTCSDETLNWQVAQLSTGKRSFYDGSIVARAKVYDFGRRYG
jgi:hypothetical protein